MPDIDPKLERKLRAIWRHVEGQKTDMVPIVSFNAGEWYEICDAILGEDREDEVTEAVG